MAVPEASQVLYAEPAEANDKARDSRREEGGQERAGAPNVHIDDQTDSITKSSAPAAMKCASGSRRRELPSPLMSRVISDVRLSKWLAEARNNVLIELF